MALVAGLIATVVAGFAVEANAANGAPSVIAYDSMSRTVTAGFGQADLGGAWATSKSAQTNVAGGAAVFAGVAPAHAVSATLSQVRTADTGVEAVVAPQQLLAVGNGLYVDVSVRRQANGDTYYGKVRFLPTGNVAVSLSKVVGNVETFLGPEKLVQLPPGTQPVTIQVQATGSGPVNLGVRAWRTGQPAVTTWQSSYVDTTPGTLAGAGSPGVYTYLSRTAASAASVSLRRLTVWDGGIGAPYTPPAGATSSASSASSSASSSSAASSSAASSSASTSSAAPVSTTSSSPTPIPPSNSSAGSAPLGSTNYPIPAGAIFVSPSGNDSAAGAINSPLQTVASAIAHAKSGGTIVLRGGTYHETITIPSNKTLTVQAYPGEVVWFDGTTAVTSWTQSGNNWVHSGWTTQFDSIPSYDPNNIPSGPNWTMVNPSYPMAAHPDEVWIDNTELGQVGSAAAVVPGTFFVDYANQQIVVGSNPNGHAVSATALSVAITTYGVNDVLRGFGVRRYATSVDQIGTVRLDGTGDSVENLIVTDSATTGLDVQAANQTIRDVTVLNSGMLGVHGSTDDNLMVDGLFVQNNNDEHFNSSPNAGGIKVGRSRGVVVKNSVANANLGVGVWFDESVYNANATGNKITNNTSHGLSFEISSTGILADNIVTGNGGDGFKLNNSDSLQVWNNTLSGNGRNIEIVEDARRGANLSDPGHDPRQAQPDPTEPWIIRNVSVFDNIIGPAGSYQLFVNDSSGQYSAAQLNIQVDGNQFARTSSPEIIWGIGGGKTQSFATVSAFAAATGQGQHNSETGAGLAAVAGTGPLALPAAVAAAVGQPAGVVHLGPFQS